jgi:ribosomal protein S18 acetylase RimI-like enzyme
MLFSVNAPIVELLDEAQCLELDATLVERIYEFNSEATGYTDGKLLGGCVRADSGELIAGFSGHTWGGVCVITHLWVDRQYRGRGMGQTVLQSAEAEARRRNCAHLILASHSFQAPRFYERLGYQRICTVEDWPVAHSNTVYRKPLHTDAQRTSHVS